MAVAFSSIPTPLAIRISQFEYDRVSTSQQIRHRYLITEFNHSCPVSHLRLKLYQLGVESEIRYKNGEFFHITAGGPPIMIDDSPIELRSTLEGIGCVSQEVAIFNLRSHLEHLQQRITNSPYSPTISLRFLSDRRYNIVLPVDDAVDLIVVLNSVLTLGGKFIPFAGDILQFGGRQGFVEHFETSSFIFDISLNEYGFPNSVNLTIVGEDQVAMSWTSVALLSQSLSLDD